MVLGPSRYIDPSATHVLEADPLQIRRDIAGFLNEHLSDHATLMEEWTRKNGEPDTDLFSRILREAPIRAFLVYWPLGARLHGLEWEFGVLTQKFHYENFPPERVFILAEEDLLNDREDGTTDLSRVAFDEEGNRTRYHHDLLKKGCKVRVWDTEESLLRHVSEVQLETQDLLAWPWS